jgi:hypothetical protein
MECGETYDTYIKRMKRLKSGKVNPQNLEMQVRLMARLADWNSECMSMEWVEAMMGQPELATVPDEAWL